MSYLASRLEQKYWFAVGTWLQINEIIALIVKIRKFVPFPGLQRVLENVVWKPQALFRTVRDRSTIFSVTFYEVCASLSRSSLSVLSRSLAGSAEIKHVYAKLITYLISHSPSSSTLNYGYAQTNFWKHFPAIHVGNDWNNLIGAHNYFRNKQ